MRLIDIINAPWAVTPDMLTEVQEIYIRHMRGDKIDIEKLRADTGKPFANAPKGYTVEDGVAVIPIDGVISKRMNLMSQISGGVSTELIGRDFQAAMADSKVEAIVLAIDSPGGTVDGTPELASIIFAARGVKPILACTDGMMCSAAYWIGSAADSLFVSSEVSQVGSIGVVAKHIDVSGYEAKQGIKTTEITAGKYKRAASQYAPLNDEGRALIQESLDHVYGVFVETVAAQRGTTVDDVLANMADGRVFQGSQAVNAGLVDGVATLSATISQARETARSGKSRRWAGVALAANQQEHNMDIETLKKDHPDLVAAIVTEATAGLDQQLAEAQAKGAKAEQERIASVKAQSIPGHEKLIEKMMADGTSTAADAAMAIVGAEKALREGALAAMDSEAPAVVPVAPQEETAKVMKRADWQRLSVDDQRWFGRSGGKIVD